MTTGVVEETRSGRTARIAAIVFWIGLAAGLAVRVSFAFSEALRFDSDMAVVYLMSRHVSEGEFSAFFWGQSYGGTTLQTVAGAVMAIVGPSVPVLSIVAALFWAGAAVILRAIVVRSLGAVGGAVAGLLAWFPGAEIVSTSVADPGFYGPSLVFGLGAILVALHRMRERPWWSWIVLGLLAGFSLWTSPLAVAFAAPAVLAAVIADRRIGRWLVGVAAVLVAAAPWIIETVVSRLSSVKPLGGAGSLHPESLVTLFTSMFPAAFPLGTNPVVGVLYGAVLLASIVLLVVVGVRRRDLPALLVGSASVLLVVVLVVGTGVRLAPDSVRYSGFLIPAVAFAIAYLVTRLAGRVRLAAAAVVVALAVAVTVVTVAREGGFTPRDGGPWDPLVVEVAELLEDRGVEAGYGAYWIAYTVTAASDERVTLAALAPRRFPAYEEAAEGQEPAVFVVYTGHASEAALLEAPGLPEPEIVQVGGYSVLFYDEWFDPFELEGFGAF